MWNGQLDILPTATSAPTLYPLGDSMQTWAKQVLDEAPNVPLIVVGCSMGGSCALEMARLAGDRIAALVLIGTKAGHRPEPDMRDRYIAELRDGGAAHVWPTLVHRFFGPSAPTSAVKAAEAMALDQSRDRPPLNRYAYHEGPP